MKKVFTYLAFLGAVAFMAFSCSPLPEDNSHTDVVVAAPAVNITISDVTDYTATVTIAPAGAANYYAYVVDKSDNAEELDPAKLYANRTGSCQAVRQQIYFCEKWPGKVCGPAFYRVFLGGTGSQYGLSGVRRCR